MTEHDSAQSKHLLLLAERYRSRAEVISEIIELNTALNMPKRPEHFMSDIHGEFEALTHIRRNASGVIRRKIDTLFSDSMSESERATLACIVYYPREKLAEIARGTPVSDDWYRELMSRLILLCEQVACKCTRRQASEIIEHSADGYGRAIFELINRRAEGAKLDILFESALKSVLRLGYKEDFIDAICRAIRALVIGRRHIVGDIFDRGARADLVIDELMRERSLDIEWGNHDALWLGAACGSRVCIATVLCNSLAYGNIEQIEAGYGISLRPLAYFAEEFYKECDTAVFMPRVKICVDRAYADERLMSKMYKAVFVLMLKLEGEVIRRNPSFLMDERLLLEKIDYERAAVLAYGKEYELCDIDFPTVKRESPYILTHEEEMLMQYLEGAFVGSEKLLAQAKFLYDFGGMYKIYNGNLLFHGCVPLDDEGNFLRLPCADGRCGKELMDFFDARARQAFFAHEGTPEREVGCDTLWFLWCGKNSPLCARERITTFERLLIKDRSAWVEPKNPYFRVWEDADLAKRILSAFSLTESAHIINGHIPVKKGESPIKGGGRVIVIDGGFCGVYRKETGISGYTLIYNADGMRLCAHEAFEGKESAVKNNADIVSEVTVFETKNDKIRVRETDLGRDIREQLTDLILLLRKYENGEIKETDVRTDGG